MSRDIPEADWRCFRELHRQLLERYCARVLEEMVEMTRDSRSSAHERYLKVYRLVRDRDKQLVGAFNDFRRSTAILQLGIMRRMKLLTDEDLALFSEQTQARIKDFDPI